MGLPALRGAIVAGLGFLMIIFVTVQLSTPIFTNNVSRGNVEADFWYDPFYSCARGKDLPWACSRVADPNIKCSEIVSRNQAHQAFCIMTALFVTLIFLAGLFDFIGNLQLPFSLPNAGPLQLNFNVVEIILAVVAWLFSLIAFAIGFSIPRTKYCGPGKSIDSPDFAWGASPWFGVLLWILTMVTIAVALVVPAGGKS